MCPHFVALFTDLQLRLSMSREVLFLGLWIWNDCIFARVPICWTHFPMLVSVLECLNKAECFVNTSSHGEIIHSHLSQDSFVVNDEQTSEIVNICIKKYSMSTAL